MASPERLCDVLHDRCVCSRWLLMRQVAAILRSDQSESVRHAVLLAWQGDVLRDSRKRAAFEHTARTDPSPELRKLALEFLQRS